jgi:hypothetical protein
MGNKLLSEASGILAGLSVIKSNIPHLSVIGDIHETTQVLKRTLNCKP